MKIHTRTQGLGTIACTQKLHLNATADTRANIKVYSGI